MEASCGVDAGESSPKAAARAAGMESLKHLKNLTMQPCAENNQATAVRRLEPKI